MQYHKKCRTHHLLQLLYRHTSCLAPKGMMIHQAHVIAIRNNVKSNIHWEDGVWRHHIKGKQTHSVHICIEMKSRYYNMSMEIEMYTRKANRKLFLIWTLWITFSSDVYWKGQSTCLLINRFFFHEEWRGKKTFVAMLRQY